MTRHRLYLLAIIGVSLSCYSQSIRVHIIGIEEIQGNIVMALYDSSKSFMKKPCVIQKRKVDNKTVILEVDSVILNKAYAISVFQDKNLNSKLDTGLFGIPLEKYGFSNNAKGFAGAPSFRSASFKVNGKEEITIKLQ